MEKILTNDLRDSGYAHASSFFFPLLIDVGLHCYDWLIMSCMHHPVLYSYQSCVLKLLFLFSPCAHKILSAPYWENGETLIISWWYMVNSNFLYSWADSADRILGHHVLVVPLQLPSLYFVVYFFSPCVHA